MYRSEVERRRVESLIAELKAGYELKPFPRHIDEAFAELAAKRRAAEPLQYWLVLPLRRAAAPSWFEQRQQHHWIGGISERSKIEGIEYEVLDKPALPGWTD